ncbi:MAG: NHL repeat-containing protein, partial [Candidatus Dormibacteria bacterium]
MAGVLAVLALGPVIAGTVAAAIAPDTPLGLTAPPASVTALIPLASSNGRQYLLDSARGGVVSIPQDLWTTRAAARTPPQSPAGRAHAADTTDPAGAAQVVKGFDAQVAGTRSWGPYSPPMPSRGAGTIETVVGGLCDGLPALQASVVPGSVTVDMAGRIFWVDQGWNAHPASATIRTIDQKGRVRTLGGLFGPLEGLGLRGAGATLMRLAPDQAGGVFYSVSLSNRGLDHGYWEDLPTAGTIIAHLRADGTDELVSGAPNWGFYDVNTDGRSYRDAAFDSILAMASDTEGNLYVADGYSGAQFTGSGVRYESPYSGALAGTRGDPQGAQLSSPPGATDVNLALTTIRFLNRGKRDITFYPGTKQQLTVAAGKVGTIVGSEQTRVDAWDPFHAPGGTQVLASPAVTIYASPPDVGGQIVPPQPFPEVVDQATLGFVDGLSVLPDGTLMMLESDHASATLLASPTYVRLLGVNTSGSARVLYGTSVAAANVGQVGGGKAGYSGDGGPASSATFDARDHDGWYYGDLAAAPDGRLVVADTLNNRIREISPSGAVTTLAGTGAASYTGSGLLATRSALDHPMGVALAADGSVLIADWGNALVRAVGRDGRLRDLAGNRMPGYCGMGLSAGGSGGTLANLPPGPARNRAFAAGPNVGTTYGTAVDSHGNIYMADPDLGIIRRMAPDGRITVVAGTARRCRPYPPYILGLPFDCPAPPAGWGDGGSPLNAVLQSPTDVLVDPNDNLYIADGGAVRFVNFRDQTVQVQGRVVVPDTIATIFSDPALVTNTPLSSGSEPCPFDTCVTNLQVVVGMGPMALDEFGTLYVSSVRRSQVIAINFCGIAFTVAGNGVPSHGRSSAPNGDGGPALAASLSPRGLAYDRARHLLLVADPGVSPLPETSPPDYTNFASYRAYIEHLLDGRGASRIRAVNIGGRTVQVFGRGIPPGAIDTYAGGGACHTNDPACSFGDGGPARAAGFFVPFSLALLSNGRLVVAEFNGRLRAVEPSGEVATLAGWTPDSYVGAGISDIFGGECGDGGPAGQACFAQPARIAADGRGNLLVSDVGSGRVRRISAIERAPARPMDTPLGPGPARFSTSTRLATVAGLEATSPNVVVDSTGEFFVMGNLTDARTGDSRGCGLWSFDQGSRDRYTFLGAPDGSAQPSSMTEIRGVCSLAVSPQGAASAPPPGTRDRLVFSASDLYPFWEPVTQKPVATVTTGASRDGGRTFLVNPSGVPVPVVSFGSQSFSLGLIRASVAGFTPDGSGIVAPDEFSELRFAQSTGGATYGSTAQIASSACCDAMERLVPIGAGAAALYSAAQYIGTPEGQTCVAGTCQPIDFCQYTYVGVCIGSSGKLDDIQ